MKRFLPHILVFPLCVASIQAVLAPIAGPALAAEEHEGGETRKKEPPQTEPDMPGLRKIQLKKPVLAAPKPLAVEGMKGVENFCGSVANSAASTRLAWQEERIKALQAQMVVKLAELDAKEAEVRDWVNKREQLLANASQNVTAIYGKMKPEAAAAQLQAMDDDTAAALLLKLKPAVASAVMSEMDAAHAARLSDLLTGAAPKSEDGKS